MKLHILSDLHLEFMPFEPPPSGADAVILAGDIDVGARAVSWAASGRFGQLPVLYVPGNHEYYGGRIGAVDTALHGAATTAPQVRILEKAGTQIGEVRFLGATLWTDFDLDGAERREAAMAASAVQVLDFRKILGGDTGFLTPAETILMHRDALAWLEARLAEPWPGPTVVITHHAPHPNSVHRRFADSAINAAFVSDLERVMGRAALWIHGHTHDSFDYRVNGTRVVANPRGYCRRVANGGGTSLVICENAAFDPGYVVEI